MRYDFIFLSLHFCQTVSLGTDLFQSPYGHITSHDLSKATELNLGSSISGTTDFVRARTSPIPLRNALFLEVPQALGALCCQNCGWTVLS